MAFFKRNRSAFPFGYCECAIFFFTLTQLSLPVLSAQTSTQQRVYGAASISTRTAVLAGYAKDSTTGVLTALAGAPFGDRFEGGLVAIDGQGKFLFVLNPVSNSISMYQIDGSSGALTEVPNSPFAAGPTVNQNLAPSHPISLATEKSGSFLYVGYANGDSTTTSALIPFAIVAANPGLVLTSQLSLDFGNGAPIQMLTDPKGLRLYVGMGPGGNQSAIAAGTMVFSIDASNGVLTAVGNAGGGSDWGRAIAIDPQGRFFFDGWGQSEGFLDSGLISPVDGTSSANFTLNLGQGVFPFVLLVDSSGKFLYVQTNVGLLIYSIDQVSGVPKLLNGPLASFAFGAGTAVADPMGPYFYSLGRSGVDAFKIDPRAGSLVEIPGAPFATGSTAVQGGLGLAISESSTLNATGPAAQLFPSSADLGQTNIGKISITRIISLVNTGGQLLAVNGISITGASAGDFSQSNTCGPTLAPNANCSISVLFTPSMAGLEQAMLQVTDDAAGSPQSALLSGTGVTTASNVTLSPASLDFGTVAEGVSVASKIIQLTNSGSSALHVSGIATSGANPGDFSQISTCLAALVAVQGSCAITVNFAPLTEGQRTASIVVTDDAANSPQSIQMKGSLVSAFQLAPAPGGSASAAVSAGRTAGYALQLTPGPGYTGNVSLSCNGAPVAAACSIAPMTIIVANGNVVPFEVMVTTSGSAFLVPWGFVSPELRLWFAPVAVLTCMLILTYVSKRRPHYFFRQVRQVGIRCAGITAIAALVLVHLSGCGGGSSTTSMPERIVTPPGVSTITVTASSGSVTPQTIQLTLTVH